MAAATAVNTAPTRVKICIYNLRCPFWSFLVSMCFEFGLNLTADFKLRFMWVSLLFITIHLLYKQVSLHPKDTVTDRDSDSWEGDLWC